MIPQLMQKRRRYLQYLRLNTTQGTYKKSEGRKLKRDNSVTSVFVWFVHNIKAYM